MKASQPLKIYKLTDEQHPARLFKLERMDDHYDQAGGVNDAPHRHHFYSVIWCRQGKGIHYIDLEEHQLRANQLYFLTPGQIHRLHFVERSTGWVLSFNDDFLAVNNISSAFIDHIKLFQPYRQSQPLEVSENLTATLNQLFDAIAATVDSEMNLKLEAVAAYLRLLLIHSHEACDLPLPIDSSESCLLVDFKKEVDQFISDTHKVSDFAQRLGVTSRHLNDVVRDTLGHTAKDYITERLMLEAKRLLIHSSASIKEVAIDLGFKEPVHFSNFFKKEAGQSPNDFRARFSSR